MLKRLIFLWLLSFGMAPAAFDIATVAPGAIARGGIVSVAPGGSNPAAIVNHNGGFCGLNYANLYSIKNLQCWDADLLFTVRSKNGFAVRLNVLGNTVYQEKSFGFSYGRLFSELMAVGATVSYYDLAIVGYRRTGAVGFNCGAKFFPDTTLSFALLFENVNAPKICGGQEKLPQTFVFGWQWQPLGRGELTGEIFKDTRRPFIFRSGLRIEIAPGCDLLAGVQFNPDRFSGGIALTWRKIRLTCAVQHHPTLPFTFYYGCGLNF